MKKLIFLLLILCAGCTDTDLKNFTTFGEEWHIRCYSGGQLIYEGDSTGKLRTVSNSDGWAFKDKKTGKFVRVSGDCIVEN